MPRTRRTQDLHICPRCLKRPRPMRTTGKRAGYRKAYCNECYNRIRRERLAASPRMRERKREVERNHYYRRHPEAVPHERKGKTRGDRHVRGILGAFGELVKTGRISEF